MQLSLNCDRKNPKCGGTWFEVIVKRQLSLIHSDAAAANLQNVYRQRDLASNIVVSELTVCAVQLEPRAM